MKFLPEKMPSSFETIYTPVVDAGSQHQIEYLARLLDTQLIASGDRLISNVTNKRPLKLTNENPSKKPKFLNSIKPIEYSETQRMSIDSFNRILHAEGLLLLFFNLSIYFY